MTTAFETPHGAFSWTELMTTDVAAAKNFYGKLLGWQFREMDMGKMIYNVIGAGGQDVGGIMPMPPDAPKGMPPGWGSYVTVNNVDAVSEKVPGLGGKILVPPTDIPTVGRFCVIQDPQGAMISLITYLPRK